MRWDACNTLGSSFSHGGYSFFSRRIFFFLTEGISFSHRTHRYNRTHLRTVSNSQNAFGIQSSQNLSAIIMTNKGHNEAYILPIGVSRWSRPFPSGEGKGEGPSSFWPLCVLYFCVNLWEIEHFWDSQGIIFSHRTHRLNRTFLRTVSNSQNASGIQISQNVTAKDRCWMLSVRCWWLAKEASEWINIPIKTQAAKEGYLGDHSLLHSERGWGWGFTWL